MVPLALPGYFWYVPNLSGDYQIEWGPTAQLGILALPIDSSLPTLIPKLL